MMNINFGLGVDCVDPASGETVACPGDANPPDYGTFNPKTDAVPGSGTGGGFVCPNNAPMVNGVCSNSTSSGGGNTPMGSGGSGGGNPPTSSSTSSLTAFLNGLFGKTTTNTGKPGATPSTWNPTLPAPAGYVAIGGTLISITTLLLIGGAFLLLGKKR
jgi:hypothetical protein